MKLIKRAFAIVLTAVLLVSFIPAAVAETIVYYDGYYYTYINNESVALTGWNKADTTLAVPSVLNGRAVKAIPDRAFYADQDITGLDFTNADNLTDIGIYAFANCPLLSGSLIFHENLEYIGECAFTNCVSLQQVSVNSDIEYITLKCFDGCTSLTRVELNGAVETLDAYSFANCTALEYVSIPTSVTSIASTAFLNDTNLTLGVYCDSYAHNYAVENGINYILLDPYVIGDADGDGEVTIRDVTAIQKVLADMTVEDFNVKAADIGGNGLDITDATKIQRYLAEFENPYNIGQVVS